jgi:hypothetical protein
LAHYILFLVFPQNEAISCIYVGFKAYPCASPFHNT